MDSRKILVIGLDGATFRLIDPWIAEGKLPNLAAMQSRGSRGSLRSTVRPESSVAWSSFATGVNPGKHGVFGFVSSMPDYRFRINTSQNVQATRFWQIAGKHSKQVGLLNIPMTYPPETVNGFLVSGMLTPSTHSQFTYPPQLKNELLGTVGDYIISVDDINSGKEAFIKEVQRGTDLRCKAALHLMRSRPWDLMVVVFIALDRLQHFLWSDMDAVHPRHSSNDGRRFGNAILEQYRHLDTMVGELWRQAGDDTIVILVSDHGFNGFHKTLHVNAWLRQVGLVHYTATSSTSLENRAEQLRHSQVLRRIKRRLPFIREIKLANLWQQTEFARHVDWSQTKAFFSAESAIRINLAGREIKGCVSPGREYEELREEIAQQLLTLRDPETGQAPIEAVYRREDLYDGPYLESAPDLVVEPKRHESMAQDNYVLSSALADTLFGTINPRSGNHDLEGIFMACGPGIRGGVKLHDARIIDIAPTILHAMGLPIPGDMDGRALVEILDDAENAQEINGASAIAGPYPPQDEVFDETEKQQAMERLRSLGYLD